MIPLRRLSGFVVSAALHAAAVALLALLPRPERGAAEPAPATTGTASRFVVTPVEAVPGSGDQVLEDEQGEVQLGAAADDVKVDGFEFDIAPIRARRNWLFPFLTTDFLFLERVDEQLRSATARMINPHATGRRTSGRPVLFLADAELQAIADRAWSRRERWIRFSEIARLAGRYDPHQGRLPDVIRAYLDQNLLQPYHDGAARDPRFWAMLACVADHVEFVDWIRSFTREHPSSRTTTELLFLLDEFAQGSRDTLLMLLATHPQLNLYRTRQKDRAAYDFAVSLRRQYGEWVSAHGLDSAGDIRRHYDGVRLRILSTIIETTPGGYRASDARFLAGEILFNQNNLSGAMQWWRRMQPHPSDSYVAAATEVLDELHSRSGGPSPAQINRILGAEHRRWLDFSRDRLKRFGYTFETF